MEAASKYTYLGSLCECLRCGHWTLLSAFPQLQECWLFLPTNVFSLPPMPFIYAACLKAKLVLPYIVCVNLCTVALTSEGVGWVRFLSAPDVCHDTFDPFWHDGIIIRLILQGHERSSANGDLAPLTWGAPHKFHLAHLWTMQNVLFKEWYSRGAESMWGGRGLRIALLPLLIQGAVFLSLWMYWRPLLFITTKWHVF